MTKRKLLLAIAFVAAIAVMMPSTSYAQGHAVGRSGGGHVVTGGARVVTGPVAPGHAVPRPPYSVGRYPFHPYYPYYPYYRPYYYGYPGFSFGLGFYYGYPYGYYPYAYGYPYYSYAPYGYAYPAYPYPYPYAGGTVGVEPGGAPGGTQSGVASGGIRITDAPKNADVFVDGNYVGKVDDFDGTFQHLNLQAGSHHVEVRAQGYETLGFDVRIDPGQTINYRARMRQVQ